MGEFKRTYLRKESDKEEEFMCEDMSRATDTNKTFTNVVMGMAKIGKSQDDELRMGKFGFGLRNPIGQRLHDFLEERLFMNNSFFQKPPHRKRTWVSHNIKMDKKKIMSNVQCRVHPITVRNSILEVVDEYIHPGQKIQLGMDGQGSRS
ncbi:unnamed protein product [Euphydryas editha]|uniref:Uncharacterized protein n=1 Tax=Euphydryas editha TaxID=104508 RepID=A0AAU9UXE5_EUPED|nr:unnamed protein product [Euphydryas editha]